MDTNRQSETGTTQDATSQQTPQDTTSRKRGGFFRELLNIALIAAFVVVPIRIFIAQPFIVSGSSMNPTFENGDYLIVDQLTYHLETPERGEVVIFRYPNDPSKFFIKRIIGLPGETVTIENEVVTIQNDEYPNGVVINEPYVSLESSDNLTVTLGVQEYFVLGDNRTASSDSRVWGPLSRNLIVGRAFLRLFPVGEAEVFPGNYIIR